MFHKFAGSPVRLMFPFFAALAVVLCGVFVSGAVAQGAWDTFTSPKTDFTVLMPAEVTEQTMSKDNVEVHMFLAKDGDTVYGIQAANSLSPADASAFKEFHQGVINGMKESMSERVGAVELKERHDISGQGWTGEKDILAFQGGQIVLASVLSTKRDIAYTLFASPVASMEDADQFINSFVLKPDVATRSYPSAAFNQGRVIGHLLGYIVGIAIAIVIMVGFVFIVRKVMGRKRR